MKANFAKAMKIELVYEGGKDNDPVDPGGRTNQGIIQREYSAYRLRKGLPNRDVFLMEDAERDEIYDTQYGKKIHFDELPPGVDIVMLDGAINSGVTQSVKWAQRALGLNADGVLGMVTMERIQNHPDHDALIADILERRRAFLKALKTYWRFGKGWMARVDNLQKVGQSWAMGSVGPTVVYVPDGHKKAKVQDAPKAPSTAPAAAMQSGGAITTGITTVQSVFEPLQGTPMIDKIVLGLAVVSALVVAGGIAYGLWAKSRKDKLNDVLDLVAQQGAANNDNVPLEVMEQFLTRGDAGKHDADDPHGTTAAAA